MYHLPLLPGYGPNTNIRSSVPTNSHREDLSEAEENGYQGTYFTSHAERSPSSTRDGYITSPSPVNTRSLPFRQGLVSGTPPTEAPTSPLETPSSPITTATMSPALLVAIPTALPSLSTSSARSLASPISVAAPAAEDSETEREDQAPRRQPGRPRPVASDNVAEVVFFEYGVVVFFGLDEGQEKGIIEDIERAHVMNRKIEEDNWEIEECHFVVSLPS